MEEDGNDGLRSVGVHEDVLATSQQRSGSIAKGRRNSKFELATAVGFSIEQREAESDAPDATPPCLETLQALGFRPTRIWEEWAAFSVPVGLESLLLQQPESGAPSPWEEELVECYVNLLTAESSFVAPAVELLPPDMRAVRTILLLSTNPYKPNTPQPLAVCGDVCLYLDPELLRPYYTISGSGESSWEPPLVWTESQAFVPALAILKPQSSQGVPAIPLAPTEGDQLAWHVYRDNTYMTQYFVNEATGEASWVPPELIRPLVVESEGAAVQWDAPVPERGELQAAPQTATKGESNPSDNSAEYRAYATVQSAVRSRLRPAGETACLAVVGGWEIYESTEPETRGHLYYHNRDTGGTTWRAPASLLDVPEDEWTACTGAGGSKSSSSINSVGAAASTPAETTVVPLLAVAASASSRGPAPRVSLDFSAIMSSVASATAQHPASGATTTLRRGRLAGATPAPSPAAVAQTSSPAATAPVIASSDELATPVAAAQPRARRRSVAVGAAVGPAAAAESREGHSPASLAGAHLLELSIRLPTALLAAQTAALSSSVATQAAAPAMTPRTVDAERHARELKLLAGAALVVRCRQQGQGSSSSGGSGSALVSRAHKAIFAAASIAAGADAAQAVRAIFRAGESSLRPDRATSYSEHGSAGPQVAPHGGRAAAAHSRLEVTSAIVAAMTDKLETLTRMRPLKERGQEVPSAPSQLSQEGAGAATTAAGQAATPLDIGASAAVPGSVPIDDGVSVAPYKRGTGFYLGYQRRAAAGAGMKFSAPNHHLDGGAAVPALLQPMRTELFLEELLSRAVSSAPSLPPGMQTARAEEVPDPTAEGSLGDMYLVDVEEGDAGVSAMAVPSWLRAPLAPRGPPGGTAPEPRPAPRGAGDVTGWESGVGLGLESFGAAHVVRTRAYRAEGSVAPPPPPPPTGAALDVGTANTTEVGAPSSSPVSAELEDPGTRLVRHRLRLAAAGGDSSEPLSAGDLQREAAALGIDVEALLAKRRAELAAERARAQSRLAASLDGVGAQRRASGAATREGIAAALAARKEEEETEAADRRARARAIREHAAKRRASLATQKVTVAGCTGGVPVGVGRL